MAVTAITPTSFSQCLACGGRQFAHYARKGAYAYLRCDQCRLLAIDPMPSESAIEQHYIQKFKSGNYSTIRAFAPAYRVVYREYVDWMKATMPALERARCLDIGCFTGELVDLLINEGRADAYGVELQDEAASIAETRLPGRVFRHNIDHPSAFLADGSFDAITMMGLVEHVQRPDALLTRARALLKDGGWVFIETPNASSLGAKVSGSFWPCLAPVEHLHLFSEEAIERVLRQAGFRLGEIRVHVKPLPLAYVYEMLQTFGPGMRRLMTPFYKIVPESLRQRAAPFYVGEMLVAAQALPRSS
jgi:SAM-dependent methyltransferase